MHKRSNQSKNNHKQQRIEKSLDDLLCEVFSGEYQDFRAYLAQGQFKELWLANKNLEGKPLNLLGEALKDTSVTSVNLAFGKIGDAGAKDFAAGLKDTSVTAVFLGLNQIGDAGAKDFAAGLKGTSFTTVFLGLNQIGDAGARSLLAAIPETNLTELELDLNNISPKLLKEIKNALDKNKLRLKEVPIILMAISEPKENTALSDKKYEECQESSEQLEYAAEIICKLPREIGQSIIAMAMRQSPPAIAANYNNFLALRAKAKHEMLETQFKSPEALSANEPPRIGWR